MKKMSVKKEVLTIIMIAVIVLAISSQVFATGTSGSPIQIPTINTNTTSEDANTIANETANPVTPTNIITPTTNTTGSTYENNTTLPQTGDASDYAIFMIIVVAVVIAIYAYRKVKEYNI